MAEKKKEKIDHNKPDRKFVCILYPDATNYVCDEILTKITQYADEWSFILHDRDVDENDEIKKPHYHVCMRFVAPRTRKAIVNVLGYPKLEDFERAKKWKSVNRYLLHLDDDDKTRYGDYEVTSNFDYRKLVNVAESEGDKVQEIIGFIWTKDCKIFLDLVDWALSKGLYSELRRGYPLIKDYYNHAQEEKKRRAHNQKMDEFNDLVNNKQEEKT